ncbi:MAG: rRNA pseudouridine synthase [Mogibacterium sp.]|nr:rRNA pseudouridine synthase [Mogibacterium sp.]
MRLDKFLSEMGAGTRTELKKNIRAGRVTVDGAVVRDPGAKVEETSAVVYCGQPVAYEAFVYYMLNKPAGVISASDDPREATVVDLIAEQKRKDLFPVGRLDRDTEGLLLITNDGALAHRLLSPKHHVDKVYYARVSGAVTETDVDAFRAGLLLSDGLACLPADLRVLSTGMDADGATVSEVEVTIREGKFHQIKRMFEAVGREVLYLKRLAMGPLTLDPDLPSGAYRRLTRAEVDALSHAQS